MQIKGILQSHLNSLFRYHFENMWPQKIIANQLSINTDNRFAFYKFKGLLTEVWASSQSDRLCRHLIIDRKLGHQKTLNCVYIDSSLLVALSKNMKKN